MRLGLSLLGLLGQAVADQCFLCSERFDSNGVLQTDHRSGEQIVCFQPFDRFTSYGPYRGQHIRLWKLVWIETY